MTEDEIINILHSGDLSELWKNGYRKLTNAEKEYLTNEGWNISTD